MRFGSLFSGVGGFDLGLERAGMECAWQCEIDPYRREVLERHWPGVVRHEDVRDVCRTGPERIGTDGGRGRNGAGHIRPEPMGRREASPVDLICGGFPCQDLSVAGKRAGLAGARSGLFFEFARIVGEVRPEWLLIENVPGLLSSNGGRDFGVILDTLGEFGYGLAWRILDSRFFGVPQRRRRVYIVGHPRIECAAAVLFEPPGLRRHTAAGRAAGESVAAPLVSGSGSGGIRLAGGLPVEGATVRRLTPTECERLQAFPDGWTHGSDGKRYAAMGDAVTVNVIQWIGERMMAACETR